MSEQTAKTSALKETRAAIACRLRHRVGRRGPSATAGEVEIENVSPDAIEIEVTMHPLQYLNVVITDSTGALVPAAPYGRIFSPREIPYTLRLAPGEKYIHNVSLLGTVPEEKQAPGTYTVRAAYEYNGLTAVSEPLLVDIPAPEADDAGPLADLGAPRYDSITEPALPPRRPEGRIMDPAVLDDIEHTLAAQGPDAAVNRLCDRLRQDKDYHALFYALLMKKRHELGVSPVPTGPAKDLPKAVHAPYEDAIRDAGRLVGGLYVQDGQLPQAWAYFRMLGEPEPIRAALDAHTPADGEDLQPLVQIAFYEGVHPRKGFDWILDRFGICSAITNLGGQELPHPPEDRQYCLRRLVRALYTELCGRLAADIERHDGKRPAEADAPEPPRGTVLKLIEGRDWLFADDGYHIDTSHLSSVVQMAVHMTPCDELHLARELCAYGKRLSPRFHGRTEPPFDDLYEAHDRYLSILTGDDVEGGLAYFHAQAEKAEAEGEGTFSAEVLVNLLLRLERPRDALAVARKHLVKAEGRRLTCPGVAELAQQVGDYRTLAEAAREQGDAVHFLAGLLGARKG